MNESVKFRQTMVIVSSSRLEAEYCLLNLSSRLKNNKNENIKCDASWPALTLINRSGFKWKTVIFQILFHRKWKANNQSDLYVIKQNEEIY